MADFSMGLIALLSQLLRIARPATREQIFTEYLHGIQKSDLFQSQPQGYFHSHMDWNRVSGAEELLRNQSGGEINPISASSLFAESKRRPDVKP
jgi:hypothetical protein